MTGRTVATGTVPAEIVEIEGQMFYRVLVPVGMPGVAPAPTPEPPAPEPVRAVGTRQGLQQTMWGGALAATLR